MKKLLSIVFIGILLSFQSNSKIEKQKKSIDFSNTTILPELIVIFEDLSEKEFMDLDLAIVSVNGLTLKGYCQRLKCYYFNYDDNIFKSEDQAFEALTIATKKYKPLLKTGTTSELVNQICKQ